MKYMLRHLLLCCAGAVGIGTMFMLGCQKDIKPQRDEQPVASAPAAAAQPVQPAEAGQTEPLPENAAEEAKAISAVIYGQVNALNRRDVNGVLSALDPTNSQVLELTRQELAKNFATYRLHTQLEAAKLEKLTANSATVNFTQLTRRISGPAFRDNRVIGVYSMKKIGGAWRIINTRPIDIQFLDGKP